MTTLTLLPNCGEHQAQPCECGCGKPAPIATVTSKVNGRVKGQPCRFIQGHHHDVRNPLGAPMASLRHGACLNDGMTPEYRSYVEAKRRCTNPNCECWEDYGGRGIKFLLPPFPEFLAHIGLKPSPQHSIDRIDNDGNYEICNVRWATRSEQQKNKRKR